MENGFRFRLYPSLQQQQTLLQWIGCQRFIYNAKVAEDKYFRTFSRKSLSLVGQAPAKDQQYSHFKSVLTPWLSEVPSQVLRNGATRWMQAYSRYFQGLAGRPTHKKSIGKQAVWLTNELFNFAPVVNTGSGETAFQLTLGTKRFPVGNLRYIAHRSHSIPASISISVDNGKWFVSFCNIDEIKVLKPEEVANSLSMLTDTELSALTVGVDRGVAIPVCASNGNHFSLTSTQQKRILKKEQSKKRWQRKMSRRIKGSSGWKKAKCRANKAQEYARHVRNDFAHQTSCCLVDADNPQTRLLVFEKLNTQGMTRKPKARQNEQGQWLRNQAKAKAGLNKSILASCWGNILLFARYKALRANKLVIEVSAHYTSQTCGCCGHTHSDNRQSQAMFSCIRCGHQANADDNASQVIAKRGVGYILSGEFKTKNKKKTMRTKQKVGAECPEPLPEMAATPGEIRVSRLVGTPANAQIADLGNPRLQAEGFSGG